MFYTLLYKLAAPRNVCYTLLDRIFFNPPGRRSSPFQSQALCEGSAKRLVHLVLALQEPFTLAVLVGVV